MTVGVDRPDFRMFVLGYPADAFVPLAKRETKNDATRLAIRNPHRET